MAFGDALASAAAAGGFGGWCIRIFLVGCLLILVGLIASTILWGGDPTTVPHWLEVTGKILGIFWLLCALLGAFWPSPTRHKGKL